LDKTGTLTESRLTYDGAEVYGTEEDEFLALAYEVLLHSPHAAAVSFCENRQSTRRIQVSSVEIRSGRGVRCLADGVEVRFGNAAWMREFGIDLEDSKTTAIFGAREGKLLGCLRFSAHLKEGVSEGIEDLRTLGIRRIALLSGDGEETVSLTAKEAGITETFGGLAPHEKAEIFRSVAEEQRKERNPLCAFCGDGLNDSAVIAEADVGIAMGRAGSALSVECADVVLMDDDPRKLARAIRMAKRTARIATQNIVLSLGIKLAVLAIGVLLAVLGKGGIPMGLAIVADVGSALLAVLNALRASK
jgi:Cd2+/Zn2+-exporting ATPase